MSSIPMTAKAFRAWLESHKDEMDQPIFQAGINLHLALTAINENRNNEFNLALAKEHLQRVLTEFVAAWEARKGKPG